MAYRKTVLVVRLSALGDVAILEPVLRLRAEVNPDVLFVLAAPPLVESLFGGILNVRFVPTKKRQSPKALYEGLADFHPDVVADMHHVNRVVGMDWLFRLHGVPVRSIDKHTDRKKPSWLRYDEVFDRCGLRGGTEEAGKSALRALAASPIVPKASDGRPVRIGVAPFAQHAGKIWPLDLMEAFVGRLSREPETEVLLFGSREESAVLDRWAERYPHVASIAGKQPFAEELAQIRSLTLMVSMDSANMHFASCMGVPVVSIWGATHPGYGFYGWRQNPAWAVQADLPCRPCSKYGNKPCAKGDYPCLRQITPERVLQTVRQVIQSEAE